VCGDGGGSGSSGGAANCVSTGAMCHGQTFEFCYTGSQSNCTGAYYVIGSLTIDCKSCSTADLQACATQASMACLSDAATD
jgi:hypothetical protein